MGEVLNGTKIEHVAKYLQDRTNKSIDQIILKPVSDQTTPSKPRNDNFKYKSKVKDDTEEVLAKSKFIEDY